MPSLKVSLLLVTFQSSGVVATALAAFRRELASAGVDGEVVIVDHSQDPAEAAALAALAPERLIPAENRGYAAGLNRAFTASSGDVVLFANPDVELLPGALAALLAALDEGWDLAGPQFELGGWLFPPAEVQTPATELRRLRAASSGARLLSHLRREVPEWARAWRSARPVAVPLLSGALVACRRATAERLGPWPEEYFLYFEEAEWLRRAPALGLKAAVVPAARARHAWGHAAQPATTGSRFAASRELFYRRHFPCRGELLLRLAPRPGLPAPPPLPLAGELERFVTGRADVVWLLSPSPAGFPAAGAFLPGTQAVAPAVARFAGARSHEGPLVVSAFDLAKGGLLGRWSSPG